MPGSPAGDDADGLFAAGAGAEGEEHHEDLAEAAAAHEEVGHVMNFGVRNHAEDDDDEHVEADDKPVVAGEPERFVREPFAHVSFPRKVCVPGGQGRRRAEGRLGS